MRVACAAKPGSSDMAAATAGGERKIRMLCLHGYLQNAETFRARIGSTRKALKGKAEFFFVDAPHEAHAGSQEEARAAGGQSDGRTWWRWTDAAGTRPSAATQYSEFEASYASLLGALQEHAPVDVLFGFSQGAAATALLLAHMGRERHPLLSSIRAAVLVGGFLPRDEAYAGVIATHAQHLALPTLHVYGLRDELVPAARSLALAAAFERPPAAAATAAAAAAEAAFKNPAEARADAEAGVGGPQRHPHPGAHMVPTCSGEYKQMLAAFLQLAAGPSGAGAAAGAAPEALDALKL